jgi:hypothetical protein
MSRVQTFLRQIYLDLYDISKLRDQIPEIKSIDDAKHFNIVILGRYMSILHSMKQIEEITNDRIVDNEHVKKSRLS